jgi:hypothetical protein
MTARSLLLIAPILAAGAGVGCGANTGTSSHQPTVPQLDGVYQRTRSAESVAQHDHVPVSQALAENYGDFVLVIRGTRFALTQQNAKACTWQYGTLGVHGGRLDMLFTDGGGRAPDNAENKPGEHFVWRARYFRGALALVPVTPTDLSPETWHRTSVTPSASALTRACRPPAAALSG